MVFRGLQPIQRHPKPEVRHEASSRHLRMLARGLQYSVVARDIGFHHPLAAEEFSGGASAIFGIEKAAGLNGIRQVRFVFDEKSRAAVFDDLRQRSTREGYDRRATGKRFPRYERTRFRNDAGHNDTACCRQQRESPGFAVIYAIRKHSASLSSARCKVVGSVQRGSTLYRDCRIHRRKEHAASLFKSDLSTLSPRR